MLLVAGTLGVYLPGLHGDFVWDDDSWTSKVSGLLHDSAGLRLMWCKFTALQQYYPLAGTTFWIDYQLWGFRTLPYHIEHVLLHAGAALMFWKLLRRLDVPGAWLAAAIFALHPVMVESAGWITERKNVLSLVLYLGALLAYGRFTRSWEGENDRTPASNIAPPDRWWAYGLALFLFLAALLAKTTAFSLPAVVLLVCWWKRGRIRWQTDVLPTVPFFALALGFCLVTGWLEKHHVRATGADWALSFLQRCLIAGRAFWFYIGKLMWSVNLCFIYPQWQLDPRSLRNWFHPVGALGALLLLWLARFRVGRGPATAAFFFTGTLFPVLGFMNAYGMRYSFVWDHWVYLPSLGLITLGAALVVKGVQRVGQPAALYVIAAVALSALGALTWQQSALYTTKETLWLDTLKKNPNAWLAHNNLGQILISRGETAAAMAHYRESLRIQPVQAEGHLNLGALLLQQGNYDQARAHFNDAFKSDPRYAPACYNLGLLADLQGDDTEAIAQYRRALDLQPDDDAALDNLTAALINQGKYVETIPYYEAAMRLQPRNVGLRNGLASALAQAGKLEEAIRQFTEVLRLSPDNPALHYQLGVAFERQGWREQAVAQYTEALRLKPDYVEVHLQLESLSAAPKP